LFAIPTFADASVVSNISSAYKYAWSNNLGWVNFYPTNSGAQVTDTKLIGYIWSENSGWINLSPTNGGVLNNKGILSGSAWGENTGWIDFSGVSIDANGKFNGTASGAIAGTINFSCAQCNVNTTWRPASGYSASSGSGGSSYFRQTITVGTSSIVSMVSDFLRINKNSDKDNGKSGEDQIKNKSADGPNDQSGSISSSTVIGKTFSTTTSEGNDLTSEQDAEHRSILRIIIDMILSPFIALFKWFGWIK